MFPSLSKPASKESATTRAKSSEPQAAPASDRIKGLRLPLSLDTSLILGVRFFVCAGILGVFYVFASETNSQWLYLLSSGMMAALVLSLVSPIFQVSDLAVDASLPPTARAGEKAAIKVSLKRIFGIGSFAILFPLRWLRLTVNVERLGSLNPNPLSKPLLIKTVGETEVFQLMAGPLRRGIYRVQSITLYSCFPFGLVWASREVKFRFDRDEEKTEESRPLPELTVYPRVYPVAGSFLQKLYVVSPALGLLSRRSSLHQQSSVVRGVREYQRGDSPRLIHWASSARLGRLLTREFEAEGLPHFDLLLDPKWDWGSEELYELALITAASLITLGHRWGLAPKLIVRNQVLVTPPPPLAPGLHASMELLAHLAPYVRIEDTSRVAARRGRRVEKLDDLIRKTKEGALIFLAPRTEKSQVELVLVQPKGKTDADRPRTVRGMEVTQPIDFKSEPDDIESVGSQLSTVSNAEEITRL